LAPDSARCNPRAKIYQEITYGNIKRYINSEVVDKFEEGQMATTTFPNGYGHGPRTHNESIALNTIDKPVVKQQLRIRKLTPREALRLMGVKDEDITNMSKNQSDASLWHLAGDSIVATPLMAMFSQFFDIDWRDKLWWH
jgi:site-specific DNA-cytosine methylase